MADKILYLFNSASRPTYKDNLYRILALPIGGVIQFRYTLDYSVPQDLRQELKGYEALIVFVDRFSKKAYNYHPIRRGKVLEDNRIQNRLIIKCQLLDYCYTNDIEEFTKLLKKTIRGIPELRKRDSRITSDGFYVQLGTRPGDAIINDSERWHEIVDSIYQTPAFNSDPTTFLKLSVKSEKAKSLTLRGNDGVAFIKSDNTYSLEIFYYDPDMGKIDKNIAISFKEPLEKYGPDRYNLGAISDLLSIQFKARKALSSLRTSIDILFESQGKEKYRLTLPVKIPSWSLLSGIIFYSVIGFLTFIVPKICSLSGGNWSLIFEVMRYLILVRLFIKFGTLLGLPFKS